MLKKIIRSVLWRTGITQRVQNAIWQSVTTGPSIRFLNGQTRHKKFPLHFEHPDVQQSFAAQNNKWATVHDYVAEIINALIDPVNGIIITAPGTILEQSRHHPYMFPGTLPYRKYKAGKAPVLQLDEAIHFDGYTGENYYHFFYDVLYPFIYLQEQNIFLNKPIIVGQNSYQSRPFQWLLKHNSRFAALQWVVLDGETFVKVKKLYRPISIIGEKENWQKVIALFSPPIVQQPTRRIFQYRADRFGRTISNMPEIKVILEKHDFELADTGNMNMDEQMKLLAETRYFIGIHGAGITNIIFANLDKLAMIEILPGHSKLNTQYYWLAETLGIKYDVLLSDDMNAQLEFYLNPTELERYILKLLQQ